MNFHLLREANEYLERAARHEALSKHVLPLEERSRYAELARSERELAGQMRKLAKQFGDLAFNQ